MTDQTMTAGYVAYLTYASAKGNFRVGVIMPLWNELPPAEREAWEAAAAAAGAWLTKDVTAYNRLEP